MNELRGERALVTGGTFGIGRATAQALAFEGGHVLISGQNEARGEEVVAEIAAAGAGAEFVLADLALADDVRDLVAAADDVDVLVNNAGVYPGGLTHELPESVFDEIFAVNVKAPFLLVAGVATRMVERGGGTIINVTTMAAEFGMAGLGTYGASKAAIALPTKVWAAEYGPLGIRVNAVSPGPIKTPGTQAMGEGFAAITSTIPLGRAAEPKEIAGGDRLPRLRQGRLPERRRRPRGRRPHRRRGRRLPTGTQSLELAKESR